MILTTRVPTTLRELDQVRDLMRGFVAWHRSRHQQDLELIERYFDAVAFETELASLPGYYAPPHGQLLLTSDSDAPVGCVALRRIDESSCEMKRMFVYPSHHGRGVGRLLAAAILTEARGLGYCAVRLDTSFRQIEALRLYRSLGFREIAPYYDMPDEMRSWLVFMELNLDRGGRSNVRSM